MQTLQKSTINGNDSNVVEIWKLHNKNEDFLFRGNKERKEDENILNLQKCQENSCFY